MTMTLIIPGRGFVRTISTDDFAEASRLYRAEQEASGEGSSTFREGEVRDRRGDKIARVSYNGRVWRLDPAKPDGGGRLIYCPGSDGQDEGRPDIFNEGRESVWGRKVPNPYATGTLEQRVFEAGAAFARSYLPTPAGARSNESAAAARVF